MLHRAARALVFLLAAAVLLLGAAHTAAWFWAVGQLERGLAAQLDALRSEGWAITSAGQVRAGWPFAAAVDLAQVVIARPGLAGFTWRADTVRVEVTALHPGTLRIVPAGRQSLGSAGAGELAYEAVGLRAEVALDMPERMLLHADQVSAPAPYDARASDIEVVFGPGAASAKAGPILLPDTVQWPLGREVARFALHGTVPGAPDRAGTLRATIQDIALDWGPLGLSGRGLVTYGPARPVTFGGTVRVTGAPEAVAALRAAGLLNQGQATAANAVLGLLLRGAGPGGAVEVPAALQDGVVGLAGIPLVRLPALPWLVP